MTTITITTRTDLHTYLNNTRGDLTALGSEYVEAVLDELARGDHPAWGADWADWLEEWTDNTITATVDGIDALKPALLEGEDGVQLPCPRFRRSATDGASEILTIVQIDGRADYLVQITSGPDTGDDFVGLYDLDGDQLALGNATWEIATTAPAEVIEAVEFGWETGSNSIERI